MAAKFPLNPLAVASPPPRRFALAEWALVPLRAFLGVTFVFAGLQKLSNPAFFRASSPISIQSQLAGAVRLSPLHSLLHGLEPAATVIGWTIAYSELAIGLGTLLGLKARLAAVGGALLSLSLFLTVSFHASPYYTGADIVFFFAWLPLILSETGTWLSADAWLARGAARLAQVPTTTLVSLPFEQVRTMCGHFVEGGCGARDGAICDPGPCPVLAVPVVTTPPDVVTYHRRSVVIGATSVAAAAGVAAIVGSTATALGHMEADVTPTGSPGGPTTSTTLAQGGTSGGRTLLGAASHVPVGSAAAFTDPATGDPALVIHVSEKEFKAYDAVCPHAGCTVAYAPSAKIIACPCHGSEFEVATGSVIQGPAPHGLAPLKVVEASNGDLYLE